MKIFQPSKIPTVYLAGKVGGAKWELAESFEGEAKFIASDGRTHGPHLLGYYENYGDMKWFVIGECLPLLESADLVIAYLDQPGCYGSVCEVAFSTARFEATKPIHIIVVDDSPNGAVYNSATYDAYWFLCSLPFVESHVVSGRGGAEMVVRKALDDWQRESLTSVALDNVESPLEKTFLFTLLLENNYDYTNGVDDEGVFFRLDVDGSPVVVRPQYETHLEKNYRLDFLVEAGGKRLGVEIDGHDFHERTKEQATRDKGRDRALAAAGYTVLRFTGSEVYREPIRVTNEVLSFARQGGA